MATVSTMVTVAEEEVQGDTTRVKAPLLGALGSPSNHYDIEYEIMLIEFCHSQTHEPPVC